MRKFRFKTSFKSQSSQYCNNVARYNCHHRITRPRTVDQCNQALDHYSYSCKYTNAAFSDASHGALLKTHQKIDFQRWECSVCDSMSVACTPSIPHVGCGTQQYLLGLWEMAGYSEFGVRCLLLLACIPSRARLVSDQKINLQQSPLHLRTK